MSIVQTVFFYLFILGICLLLSRKADKNNNVKYVYLTILILALVGGLRHYSVGYDTEPYMLGIENFFKTKKIIWPYVSFSIPYGYFTSVVYHIYHNYNFLLFIEALIINFFLLRRFWDFRKASNFNFIVFLYLVIIYLRTFNLNVQYLALSIVFFATKYLDENKNFKFIILTATASLLHTSALIGVIFYIIKILNIKKITKKQLLVRFIGGILGIAGIIYAISNMYDRYSYYIGSKQSSMGLMVFLQLFVFIVTLLFNKFLYKSSNNKEENKKIALYYLIGIIFSFSYYIIGNAGRISYYFMIFEPIFYGIVIKERKDKLFKIFLVAWFIIYAIYVLFDTAAGTMVFPYSFFIGK